MGERDEGCRQESVLMRSTATIRRLSLFQAALQQPERCLISFTALVMCLSTHTDNASALEELNGQLSKRRDLARLHVAKMTSLSLIYFTTAKRYQNISKLPWKLVFKVHVLPPAAPRGGCCGHLRAERCFYRNTK